LTGRPAHHLVWSGDWTLVRQGFVIDGEAFVMTNWEGLSQGPPLADGWSTLPSGLFPIHDQLWQATDSAHAPMGLSRASQETFEFVGWVA
jgi:hypothetical protein